MMKILFYGFRHGHANAFYKRVKNSGDAEVFACVEEDEKARKAAEASLGAVFSDKSYEELLCSDADVVAVGKAFGDRGKAVIAALRAGKHVIADKPLCTSLEELSEIRKLSRENNLAVSCLLDLRYLPQTLRAKELLDSKRLGEVKIISVNGQHCIDYAHRPAWYFEKGMHGGTINDLAIHGIDLVRYLTGLEFSLVTAARVWNAYAVKNEDFKDSAVFMAELENGAEVIADVSYSAPSQVFSMPTYWEFRFWCEKGLLTFNYVNGRVTLFEEGSPKPKRLAGRASKADPLTDLYTEIKTGKRDFTESVLRSTETALRIQQIADGRPVSL